jgi:hypothetical protein
MTRLSVLLATLAFTGCIDICPNSCQRQYDDCLDTGRSAEECDELLVNCEDSCAAPMTTSSAQ